MAGAITKPVQPTGNVTCRGAKNSTSVPTVAAAIAAAINTYLDGTEGTHPMYVVEVKVRKLQV